MADELPKYAPHHRDDIGLHVAGGGYSYAQRVEALKQAEAYPSFGVRMEVHSSHTEFYATPLVPVGTIEVYGALKYKGMPEYITTLTGPNQDWVAPWGTPLSEALAQLAQQQTEFVIDSMHLKRQIDFSKKTFGPGDRFEGVIDHIRKELVELEETHGNDVSEWADVIILAFDGAWRAGWTPQQTLDAVRDKQTKNEGREWPDWRTADVTKAIEHVRSSDTAEGPEPWVLLRNTTLPMRLTTGLVRSGFETVGDLRKLLARDPQMMTVRGIGPVAREEVRQMLAGEED